MEKILTDFIKIVRQFLAGRHTDCGGEIDDSNDGQCCGCRHYGECRKNYQFTDAIEELLKRAAEQHNKASVADLTAAAKRKMCCHCGQPLQIREFCPVCDMEDE